MLGYIQHLSYLTVTETIGCLVAPTEFMSAYMSVESHTTPLFILYGTLQYIPPSAIQNGFRGLPLGF